MNETEEIGYLSLDKDWTLSMIRDFIKALMTATLCTDIQELKNHSLVDCVWKKVEDDIKIDHNSLKNFWFYRLHMQLFCPEPIYLNDVKVKLIEYLYDKGITAKKDINWQNLLSYFNGYTKPFLYRIFNYLDKIAKSKTDTNNFADIVEYLYVYQIPNIVQNFDDKILPRLIYEKGNLKHIDIDVEEWMLLHKVEGENVDSSSSDKE